MNKGGISAVIATVLIILITMGAVAIVWVTIIPVIQDNVLSVGSDARLSIIVGQGYTVYDPEKQIAGVQVQRGTDDATLARLNIIFEIDGSSEAFKTSNSPNTNEAKIFWFNFSKYPDLDGKIPQYVSVIPVYLKNNQEVIGAVADRVEIPIKVISPNEEEISTILGDPDRVGFRKNETIPMNILPITNNIIIDRCMELNDSGSVYQLNRSLTGITTDCFVFVEDNITLDLQGNSIDGVQVEKGSCTYQGNSLCEDIDNEAECESTVDFSSGDCDCPDYDDEYKCESFGCSWNEYYIVYCDWAQNFEYPDYGIKIISVSDINVLNGVISNFKNGIFVEFSFNNVFKNLKLENNDYGLYLESDEGNEIYNITAINGNHGLYLLNSQENNITLVNTAGNAWGLYMDINSNNNQLLDITSCSNSQMDFYCDNSLGNSGINLTFGGGSKVTQCSGWPSGYSNC